MDILLLHGFASSANSNKARAIRSHFETRTNVRFHALEFSPTPRDFEFLTITGMINRVRQYVLDQKIEPAGLIGSSLGALIALQYAHRFTGVEKTLLLAPALAYDPRAVKEEDLAAWKAQGSTKILHLGFGRRIPLRFDFHQDAIQYSVQLPPPCPSVIIHGTDDEVVPVGSSREYASKFPTQVRLEEVSSNHRLLDRLDAVFREIDNFLLS